MFFLTEVDMLNDSVDSDIAARITGQGPCFLELAAAYKRTHGKGSILSTWGLYGIERE